MAMISILPPPGVVRGATPNEARDRWYDTNLVRWAGGVLKPIGGWEKIIPAPLDTRVRKLKTWRTNLNVNFLVAASLSKVYSTYANSTMVDITPIGLSTSSSALALYGFGVNEYGEETYGTPRSTPSTDMQLAAPFWTLANWGEDILGVSSIDGKLYHYDVTNPNDRMAVVAGAPLSNSAVTVTPERHVMLLQAGGNPRRLAWSAREDHTDWNFASTTNTAGYLDLNTETPLMQFAQTRAGTLVFSSSEVFQVAYMGVPYIYGAQWMGETRAMSPDSIVSDNGSVFWWATDGFKMSDGASIQTIPCPVWDYIMGRVNKSAARLFAHGGAIGLFPEIWWFYPKGDSTLCTEYVMTNYAEGWWAVGTLPRTAMVGAGAERNPLMAGEDNLIYKHESGWNGTGPEVREVFAETAALSVGTGDAAMEVRQMVPAGGFGFDSIQTRFFANRTQLGAEREFGPYHTRPDGYVDTRVSGRDVRLRIENTKNADWSVGELRLDIAKGAGR